MLHNNTLYKKYAENISTGSGQTSKLVGAQPRMPDEKQGRWLVCHISIGEVVGQCETIAWISAMMSLGIMLLDSQSDAGKREGDYSFKRNHGSVLRSMWGHICGQRAAKKMFCWWDEATGLSSASLSAIQMAS